MATNFDLSVEALPNDRYRLTVTDSPAGTASTEIAAPFSFAELADLNDVLAGRAGLNPTQTAEQTRLFGERLFKAVVAEDIRYTYTTSQARGGGVLNLRLRLDRAGALAGLPWDKLRDPSGAALTVIRSDKPIRFAPVGGLQEVLRGPTLIVMLIVLLACIGASVLLVALRQPSDVDLVVSSLRFLPQNPAPGEIFKVTIGIKNTGTTNSGQFDWLWFKADVGEGVTPDLRGTIENLRPGDTITVRGEFSFGWWERYDSTAWINPDGRAPDKNPLNNLSRPGSGVIQTSNEPFVIDFTVLPNGEPIQEARDLKGDEYTAWGLSIRPDPGADGACKNAVIKVILQNNQNALVTGKPSVVNGTPIANGEGCVGLPIVFMLDKAFGGARVDFAPQGIAGAYSFVVQDKAGDPIDVNGKALSQESTINGSESIVEITLPAATESVLNKNAGAIRAVFRGQPGSVLQKITFFQPVPSVP